MRTPGAGVCKWTRSSCAWGSTRWPISSAFPPGSSGASSWRRGLVRDPDIVLLDEPTNHLDIDAIAWLEDYLLRYGGTLVFVTHDRVFLRKLATRIIEIDRGRLIDWVCDFDTFTAQTGDPGG